MRVARSNVLMRDESVKKQLSNQEIFERQTRLCKAFANPIRLYILHQLGKHESPFMELQKALGISVPNISQHLSVLKAAGIVAIRREGRQVYCSLPIPEVKQACDLIQDMLRHQIENSASLLS